MKIIPKHCCLRILLGLIFCGSTLRAYADQDTISVVRADIAEWVKIKEHVAKLRSDWEFEKQVLAGQREGLESEAKDLEKMIESLKKERESADLEDQELADKMKLLEEATATLPETVSAMEQQLLELAKRFPSPLAKQIGPETEFIASQANQQPSGLGKRVQNLIALISKAELFNNTVVRDESETRNLEEEEKEVGATVLYFGLAVAYAVSGDGKHGWIGYPGQDSWVFEEAHEYAGMISRLLKVEAGQGDIEFTDLPIEIR